MKNKISFRKRITSFKYAFNGIGYMFRTQRNSLIHLLATFFVIILGFIVHLNLSEWSLIIFAIGLVFITELFNTAIEFLTDLISPDYHEKAGKVKDIAAGAVLITAIVSVAIGLMIFIPKFIQLAN
jgi:diacylglycerol kinase (ATP)